MTHFAAISHQLPAVDPDYVIRVEREALPRAGEGWWLLPLVVLAMFSRAGLTFLIV